MSDKPKIPDGPLTFGRLYDVFPFDNRGVGIGLSGAEFREWIAGEIRQGRGGALGISGVTVRTGCIHDAMQLEPTRKTGRLIHEFSDLTP